jgi:hypothetical protein
MRRIIVLSLVLPPVAVALQLASCRPQIDINPPKDPIKIEVKVELHIYQHAVQDLGYITGALPAPGIEPGAGTNRGGEKNHSPCQPADGKPGQRYSSATPRRRSSPRRGRAPPAAADKRA